ncbi:histidine phosphatase family protein [Paenibacillus hunanensis]|uniref:histidine phosphatase family protein n=1 Tax=Paenibacillus hunanensis TaxID=539262 RepID=UPI002026394B|nr:histidine phosphatase family protein [Paenibacillus hunanensis]MCL9661241.1 histidine phosphatase family protein [Paenibacillus hunanensis]
MTTFGLIRHGSTIWNKEGRAQGSSDIPLNENGWQQARLLGERIAGEQWDRIYASDLKRAQQTAQAIAEASGLTITLDARLRELDGGLIEGTTQAERIERWGEDWKEQDLGLETPESGAKRGLACLQELAECYPDEHILIVSHGVLLNHVLNVILQQEPPKWHSLDNMSITVVECDADQEWDCALYNCTSHLLPYEANKAE